MQSAGNEEVYSGPKLFGRKTELAFLQSLVDESRVHVAFITGIPGTGASALLRKFRDTPREDTSSVVWIDCRTIEPTQAEFSRALAAAGFESGSNKRQVLCLDHYDHVLLIDSWLREEFMATEGGHTCLVLAIRQTPTFPWRSGDFNIKTLHLDVLDRADTLEMLADEGVEGSVADEIWRLTGGHPLALKLALSGAGLQTGAIQTTLHPTELVHELAVFFLRKVDSEFIREALEAASVVRRITLPMLSEMLGRSVTTVEFDELSRMPIVEKLSDGLSVHPTVHQAIAGWLRTSDPARFTAYRQAAWRILSKDAVNVSERDTWRYTADVIYLIDDPVIREAFFPSSSQAHSVAKVRSEDHETILKIAERHDGASGRELLEIWLRDLPESVRVIKDKNFVVQGFYCMYNPQHASQAMLEQDPIAATWMDGMPAALKGKPGAVLFLRRWLTREHGDGPCPGQAACWLDAKRTYLEGRPNLQRVYAAVVNVAAYGEALAKLGFQPCADVLTSDITRAYLDFGVGSVNAWFAQLVRQNLGLQNAINLVEDSRSLELDGRSISLTPHEYHLVEALQGVDGQTLSRNELLQRGWRGGGSVGSNVVDVAIRGLRKKLGKRSGMIETVRGAGYRWNC